MAVKTICIGIKRSPKSSLADVSEAFYINEHLRLTHKLLIRDVLLAAKTKKQKYVWVKNSAIFCRKDDASRIVMIKNRSSIDKILFLFFLNVMDKLLVYGQNINGLRSKTARFKINSQSIKADVYFITESNLCRGISDSEMHYSSQYRVFRRDRESVKCAKLKMSGGGVLIAVGNNIPVVHQSQF